MLEMIKNAWASWLICIEDTKIGVLLLAGLLLLWFWERKKGKGFAEERWMLFYTTLITICCIFPLTAAFLMFYQTSFYSYQWIWSFVPVTFIISYICTILFWENSKKYKQKEYWKNAGLLIVIVAVLFLAGGLKSKDDLAKEELQETNSQTAWNVLSVLEGRENICLWAPKAILESARAFSGDICLLYGRNMWDTDLNAYSYDTYNLEIQEAYQWMEMATEYGYLDGMAEEKMLYGEKCIQQALAAGVNTILVPNTVEASVLEALERNAGVKAEQIEGYYLFSMAEGLY